MEDDVINTGGGRTRRLIGLVETRTKQHGAGEHTRRGYQANEHDLHNPIVKEHEFVGIAGYFYMVDIFVLYSIIRK